MSAHEPDWAGVLGRTERFCRLAGIPIVSPQADLAPCGEHAHPGPSTDGDHSVGPGCVPNVP